MENEPTTYPFVIIGDLQTVSSGTKTSLNGTIILQIDIWGSDKQRLVISTMADRFFHATIGEVNTNDYRFFGYANDQHKNQATDNSIANTIFQRATLTLNLKIL